MDRKSFLKKALLGAVALSTGPKGLKAKNAKLKESTYDKMLDNVGFNHLPNKETRTMKSVLHKANTRGHVNHGWLDSNHTFSFANYYNPQRMNFGVLRVINDDRVMAGRGFGTHPHDNMEIISIPLDGDLEHKDSMGNVAVIKKGDVQVMSAGTGIFHSEYNKNSDKEVKFLQIWLFPNKRDVNPRYDQISLNNEEMNDNLMQILSPNQDDQGVWIHQNAWFHMGNLSKGKSVEYKIKDSRNGVYAFIIDGDVSIEGQELNRRDGYGVWDTDKINIDAISNARVLLMEVPMTM
ncbi:MAG: pirin family protein [Saprospiraceae bacterium]